MCEVERYGSHKLISWAMEPVSWRVARLCPSPVQNAVVLGERQQAGVRMLLYPRLAAHTLEFFSLDERVCSLLLLVREQIVNVYLLIC